MISPTRDGLYVRLDPVIANNAGFIIPPDPSKWRSRDGGIEGENRGTVVAAGPGRPGKNGDPLPMECKIGDIIRFSELEFPTFTEDGHKYVLISEQDVLGIEEA